MKADLPQSVKRLAVVHSMRFILLLNAAISAFAQSPVTTQNSLPPIEGIVWQPTNQTLKPHGKWEKLGIHTLLVQWTAVDDLAFVSDAGLPGVPVLPDWDRIAQEPWAGAVILGLSGRFQETQARRDINSLIDSSVQLARLPTPLHVVGYYFPVEIDPTWTDAAQLRDPLSRLPRPLWLSVYDSANLGAENLVAFLQTCLPPDVGIFFQDGVGVEARTPEVARHYADTLIAHFGAQRVRMIAEMFRPAIGGGFRPAVEDEIRPQLAHYQGLHIYLFDGPNYLPDTMLDKLSDH